MELDSQVDNASGGLLRIAFVGEFRVDCLPFGSNPPLIHSKESFALVLEMFVEGACRVARFLRDAVGVGTVIPEPIEQSGGRIDQALASQLRGPAPGSRPGSARSLPRFRISIDSHLVMMISLNA